MNRNKYTSSDRSACFYICFDTVDSVDVFIRPVHKQIIVHTLNYFVDHKGLTVYAWCLMSNQFHLLFSVGSNSTVEQFESEFREFTTAKLSESMSTEPEVRKKWMLDHFESLATRFGFANNFQIWQKERGAEKIELCKTEKMLENMERIHFYPVKDRIVDIPLEYKYSSARDYCGSSGLVLIKKLPLLEQHLAAAENMKGSFIVRYIRN